MDSKVIHIGVRYTHDAWEALMDDDPWETPDGFLYLADLAHEMPRRASVLNSDEVALDIRYSFNDDRCPIGRHGPQTLRDVYREQSIAWNEKFVEYLVTWGTAGTPFVALHEVRYTVDSQVTFKSIQLRQDVARWAGGLISRVDNPLAQDGVGVAELAADDAHE